MSLYQHPGLKRLAFAIPVVVFIVAFFFAVTDDAQFGEAVIAATVCSIIAFVLISLVYWVIDGFKCQKKDK